MVPLILKIQIRNTSSSLELFFNLPFLSFTYHNLPFDLINLIPALQNPGFPCVSHYTIFSYSSKSFFHHTTSRDPKGGDGSAGGGGRRQLRCERIQERIRNCQTPGIGYPYPIPPHPWRLTLLRVRWYRRTRHIPPRRHHREAIDEQPRKSHIVSQTKRSNLQRYSSCDNWEEVHLFISGAGLCCRI